MFKNKRIIKNHRYDYLEHSFRIGNKVRKVSFYLPKGKHFSVNEFMEANKNIIERVAQEKTNHLKTNSKHSRFFDYGEQMLFIERAKVLYNVFYNKLSDADKEKIRDEFLRRFLVNSMAMEGGTISYDVAKAIDNKKRFDVKGINELDIPLYRQLKEAYNDLEKMHLRYPAQIKKLHKTVYKGVYSFAGQFRKKDVTFGDLNNLAITFSPENVRKGYHLAIKRYYENKNKLFDFERIVLFHRDYQAVHGFEDGNSRLGRLIMISQFMHLGYPPLLVRGTQSKAYRTSLVRAINEKNAVPLLKFFYVNYKRTFSKFWLPILEDSIKRNIAKM